MFWLRRMKITAQHHPLQRLRGFSNHREELPDSCKQYWQVRHNLTIDDDLIVYGCRLLIPRQMHREMLHEAHQGMVRMKQRARLTIYWPGLDNDRQYGVTMHTVSNSFTISS